jgi:hypothetical protein
MAGFPVGEDNNLQVHDTESYVTTPMHRIFSKKIDNYLDQWNIKVHHHVHKKPPLDPILSHMTPVHTFPTYFSNLPSTVWCSTK